MIFDGNRLSPRKIKNLFWTPYALLALLILLPLMKHGFVLTLDMVFTPNLPMPQDTQSPSFLFHALLHYLNYLLPGEIIQKIILFLILAGSGIGMHGLIKYLQPKESTAAWEWSCYFAGIFYIFNPFFYERLITGQYSVLMGYALLPYFIKFLLIFLKNPSFNASFQILATLLILSIVSIHTLGIALVITILFGSLSLWHNHNKQRLRIILHSVLIALTFGFASSYWLLPLIAGQSETAKLISSFDHNQAQAFATEGGIHAVILLQGFWAETKDLFVDPKELSPFWNIAFFFIGILIISGIVKSVRMKNAYAINFILLLAIAIILGLGVTHKVIGPINQWLNDHIPFFQGYREPQKFISLLSISYCYFGAFGIWSIAQYIKKSRGTWGNSALFVAVALPLFLMPSMFWGFSSQLQSRAYPLDWTEINEELKNDTADFKVLFLPWHQYLHFRFSERVIANPAPKFFAKPILASANPEFKNLEPQTSNKDILYLENLFNNFEVDNLSRQLSQVQVKYILLAKEVDYLDYVYLNEQKDLKLILETANFYLYENLAF